MKVSSARRRKRVDVRYGFWVGCFPYLLVRRLGRSPFVLGEISLVLGSW